MAAQWFHHWFNSPYYHILYKQHSQHEAAQVIENLAYNLPFPAGAKILDVGCGRGRHAVKLFNLGYEVTGIDLSVANISYARQYCQPGLRFFVHDMRALYYNQYFDVIINLFTSFGYFDTELEHLLALQNFNRSLKPGGLLILDYLNSACIKNSYKPCQQIKIDDITFTINKTISHNRIIKNINFEHDGQPYSFQESVCLFELHQFKQMFNKTGFTIIDTYGSYDMAPYNPATADRLLLICKKNHA